MENVMTRTITIGKRIGIATLAVLGALTLPVAVAPASASVVRPAAVDCAALQATRDGLEVRITTLQEMLAEAPPAVKGGIIAQILKLNAQADAIDQQLAAGNCP
jgi:hypothetical protein